MRLLAIRCLPPAAAAAAADSPARPLLFRVDPQIRPFIRPATLAPSLSPLSLSLSLCLSDTSQPASQPAMAAVRTSMEAMFIAATLPWQMAVHRQGECGISCP